MSSEVLPVFSGRVLPTKQAFAVMKRFTFRLVRNLENPSHYMSFAPWESFEVQQAWKELPEFRERIGRVRSHCEEFQPSTHELVATVV